MLSHYHVVHAFWVTTQLTLLSGAGALVWGTMLAAMRVSPVPIMRAFSAGYVTIFRNTPLTLIIVSMVLVLRDKLGVGLASSHSDTFIKDSTYRLAILGFIIYTSSFVCEAVRSGINTVPDGQAEAARAIGLKFPQVLGLVILPQAMRSVVAPLATVLIALTKNTTIASAISVAEAGNSFKSMIEFENIFAAALIIGAGFVILTLPTGLFLGWVANKVAVAR